MLQRPLISCMAFILLELVAMVAPARADVIVASYFDSSILRFAEDGTRLQPVVPPGGMSGVVGPGGITFGPDGLLYVSNQTSVFAPGAPDSIVQVDPSTGNVTPFITLASGYVPAGLRFGPDGKLYVSHNGGQGAQPGTGTVDCYDGTTGEFLSSVVTNLTQPTGLLFDSAGKLYISSYGDASIVQFDGTTSSTFVADGSGGLMSPSGLQFGPDGNLYVVDLLLGAVRRYDPNGASIGDFIPAGGPLDNQFPSDLLFDRLGNLLVADLGPSYTDPQGNVKAFDAAKGTYLTVFATGIYGASQLLLTP
jgi:DNA-binding beta-propeller fold protein YncE